MERRLPARRADDLALRMPQVGRTAERPDVAAVLAEIAARGSEANRAGMARYGIKVDDAWGVPVTELRRIARRLGRDHETALELWRTGCHEARLLAAFVDEPARVDEEQMERWAADFDSWDLCDEVTTDLFDQTPLAWTKAVEWAGRPEEFVKRGGFALMAGLAVHDKAARDEAFMELLALVEREAFDERNFVRKAVNWALRNIGKRDLALQCGGGGLRAAYPKGCRRARRRASRGRRRGLAPRAGSPPTRCASCSRRRSGAPRPLAALDRGRKLFKVTAVRERPLCGAPSLAADQRNVDWRPHARRDNRPDPIEPRYPRLLTVMRWFQRHFLITDVGAAVVMAGVFTFDMHTSAEWIAGGFYIVPLAFVALTLRRKTIAVAGVDSRRPERRGHGRPARLREPPASGLPLPADRRLRRPGGAVRPACPAGRGVQPGA